MDLIENEGMCHNCKHARETGGEQYGDEGFECKTAECHWERGNPERRPLCVWKDCPFDAGWEGTCEYHSLLVGYWFWELDGHKFTPAELTFTMLGDPAPASHPETADPNKETYRARYQKWANELGREECDRIVISQGGKAWQEYLRLLNKMG